MAKYQCVCGEVLTTSGAIPHPDQWQFMSDQDFEKYEGDVDVEEIYVAMKSFFRCPNSGHLLVFWDGFDQAPAWYAPHVE